MEENVRIVVTGDNRDALNKLNKVEDAVNRLNSATKKVEVKVNGIQEAERQAARLYQALERVENAALSKLPRSVQLVIAYLKAASQSAQELGGRLAFAGTVVDDLQRAKFIPAGLLAAGREVKTLNSNLLITLDTFRRISQEFARLRFKALPPAGGSQGFTGFDDKGGGYRGTGAGSREFPFPIEGGALARRQDVALPLKTIDNLEKFRAELLRVFRTTEIGTPKFIALDNAIAQVNKEIEDAQLRFQKVTTKATPGSIAALREEIAAKQAVFEQTDRNSKKFRELGDELRRLNADLTKTEKFIEGRTKGGKARVGTALQSAALGGGFPLLFGGPSFSAAGGALGGFAGGLIGTGTGFAGGIIGSALGDQFGQIAESAATLGQALNTLTADIDAVVAATGKTNTVFAQNIKALEEAGLKNTALALATQELASVVGDSGVSALKEFGSDTQRLGEVFARAMTQMQADLASLVNSLGILKGIIGAIDNAVLFRQAQESKDPRVGLALAQFRSAQKEITPGRTGQQFKKLEELRQRVVDAQREVNEEQARNIEKLSKLALQEKENLDKAKLNLQNAERALQASSIVDKFTNQLKEQQKAQLDFEARRNDIVENYEKSIATLRRNVENQISNLRLQNLRKANQLEDQRAANALADLRNQQAASRLFTAGSLGQDPAITQLEQNLRDAADTYSLRILEAEQKRAKLERDAALSVQEIGFRTDRFKIDVARQSAELSLNAQKQIDRINKNIIDRNAKFEAEKYRNERNIADLKLKVLKAQTYFELQQLVDQQQTATDEQNKSLVEQINFLKQLNTDIDSYIQALGLIEPPPALTEVQGITQATIDLSGYNEVVKESIGLQNQLKQSELAAISSGLEAAGLANLANASKQLLEIEGQVLGAFAARNLELEKTARITELTRELGSKALAEEIAGIEFATRAQLIKIQTIEQSLAAQKADLEAKVAENKATDEQIVKLKQLKKLLEQIGVLKGNVNAASAALKTEAKGELDQFIEQTTEQLNNVQARAVRVAQGIGDAIGNSLTDGIVKLTEGSATVQEVFANLLRSVADVLIQESARMIAQYVALKLARDAALGASGGVGGAGGILGTILGFGGQYADGGRPPVGKASLVGERGPELFVPSRSGTIIPNDQLGGSSNTVTVNVDAKGTEVAGNSDQSRQLGAAISRAVQAELVKQQRPGGVLHSSR